MSTQPQKRPQGGDDDGAGAGAESPLSGSAQAQKRAGELDSLLDEIDSVLESNAEEFVKGFVQKGGE
ncbi:ubiquitin-like protein Pup [Nesterenkonia lutea]|uniref:Prokaryotic ubiquitin-like protein Pup n=1 Tax=Nesterenkonia lutea TaxID=272919 RepID=A0ABR9JE27_9MICC|nr:ubiquitin-like protein Pup [Nesterenkonia lutea]MBE1524096.1 ubiquitin-like protein Pup [Nesterenkonia lutea]